METIRDLRIRLKSINSTKKITESMRMISTSKVQKTTRRLEESRAYSEQFNKIVKSLAGNYSFRESVYIAGHEKKGEAENGRPVIILITGDRGLCGGYNVNAEKKAAELAKNLGNDVDFITIGTKGRDYFKRRGKNIINAFRGLSESPFYKDAQHIGDIVMKLYNEKEASSVHLVYTEYHTMLTQTSVAVQIMPLDIKPDEPEQSEVTYETDMEELFGYAVASYVHGRIFSAMLESAVCEQCARLTGMDSAVKNSEKIIEAVTLQYNQMRQSAITQEIAEIVGGANAVEKD